MPLVTRARLRRLAITESRYVPGDTPYPYSDCRKALKQLANVACTDHRSADVEERLAAQVDLLRMALETVAARWLNADGGGPSLADQADQRERDQWLARYALRRARDLDDDRTRARLAGTKLSR